MTKLLKAISIFLFLFSFHLNAQTFSGNLTWFNPYSTPLNVCPLNYGSLCQTYSGQTCTLFTMNYHPSWFSACLTEGPFYACLNLPTFPQTSVQSSCYLKGSPCTCSFGLANGYYVYAPGFVL